MSSFVFPFHSPLYSRLFIVIRPLSQILYNGVLSRRTVDSFGRLRPSRETGVGKRGLRVVVCSILGDWKTTSASILGVHLMSPYDEYTRHGCSIRLLSSHILRP